jgi:hypothetical protein
MAVFFRPGHVCAEKDRFADTGTRGRAPGPWDASDQSRPSIDSQKCFFEDSLHVDEESQFFYSPVLQDTVQITDKMTAPMAWDSYWRMAYDRADKVLQAQANKLLRRGNITKVEFDELVKARNTLVEEFRKPLSPFGKLYSEILQPTSKLPQPSELLAKKGSVEAVLESVGKSRATVNRLSMVFRVAGPALIVLDITISTIVVMKAPAEQRGRVATREYTGLGVGVAGGAGGAWAGCVGLAALGSPSLVLPVVGEVTEGVLCAVGGILGGLGGGWAGREAGKAVGESAYDFVTTFRWE